MPQMGNIDETGEFEPVDHTSPSCGCFAADFVSTVLQVCVQGGTAGKVCLSGFAPWCE
jgi:hypothetical protein